ncbi:IclR family transcriptional regulator [Phytoactinopolyspora endophytica]|uniref:IclR family transcriptional regulator n=1 Tax=Phytoactinopolyspora endophytica TaxID=1642495 RepID=UPI00101D3D0D|nr:helix-turn-helix domain-containing protein [Phytoactinopolyspora endophytica]
MRDGQPRARGDGGEIKALHHGLEILSLMVRAGRPLSATAIGERVGLHQTSVSRIIRTLSADGYVRRAGSRGYVPDFGVFALGTAAVEGFHLVDTARPAMEDIAAEFDGFEATLATLWRGELLHFNRTRLGQASIPFSSRGFPFHLSSAALRLMADRPHAEAIALLEQSRDRQGWKRPTDRVPGTPAEIADLLGSAVERGVLILRRWVTESHVAGSIDVELPNYPPFALSVAGEAERVDDDSLRLWLHEARRRVEKDFVP